MTEKATPTFDSTQTPTQHDVLSLTVVDVHRQKDVVAYDEYLIERARTQWQFGDWEGLSQLDRNNLQNHPDRATLALLTAAARFQTGRLSQGKQYVSLAREWGASKKLICQILAAGVHNSLGRVAAIGGNSTRAIGHFESAITTGIPEGDSFLLTKARVSQQYDDLGLPAVRIERSLNCGSACPVSNDRARVFNVNRLAQIELGDAWASNTINTVIFRHHGVLTHHGRQFTAFYVNSCTLRLVQRDLTTQSIKTYDIDGKYNLSDAHNTINLGVDRVGHLHVCYDHHATQLRYRRSIRPYDVSGWTDELTMTGKAEDRVTYPSFNCPHHGFPLTLLYRDGGHNRGNARLKFYDEALENWSDLSLPVLSGSESKPWTSNAYWNHPVIGSDGSLHLSFVWRTHTLGEEQRINNINIGYACSPDGGLNWFTSKGRMYQLPITQVNAETVHPVSPGSNLINQSSMALDSQNNPHIVFYADDPDGVPQYQHLRFDGHQWHHQIISRRTAPFVLQGAGTLQIPISRPEIVIDRQDNAYVITRGDHSDGRMVATLLGAPDYEWYPDNVQVLWDQDMGLAEPVIDRVRWDQENILTLLLQYNEQPDHEGRQQTPDRPVILADIEFIVL
ncbi:putative BNR repeat neuraminidase [Paraburkholderia sp. RAU2J]|uniref:BNR repeat-containing protein n=1 Tax=Paraburkholderia sp. RAU2J TaxID=1938810 RepID=UPI000EB30398|nr:BNR repeat-containing protein [Paraburkholderia sp. RAU2J]RKT21664.1 putative BNR repeat neuraminidase [Paraburkholderia sp. RAU2J]